MRRSDPYIFDFELTKYIYGLMASLLECGHHCFLLASEGDNIDCLEKFKNESFIPDLNKSLIHYFITPLFHEKIERTAWRANTVRAVKPKLYIGTDSDTIEQARLLGVPAALYRL